MNFRGSNLIHWLGISRMSTRRGYLRDINYRQSYFRQSNSPPYPPQFTWFILLIANWTVELTNIINSKLLFTNSVFHTKSIRKWVYFLSTCLTRPTRKESGYPSADARRDNATHVSARGPWILGSIDVTSLKEGQRGRRKNTEKYLKGYPSTISSGLSIYQCNAVLSDETHYGPFLLAAAGFTQESRHWDSRPTIEASLPVIICSMARNFLSSDLPPSHEIDH